MIALHLRSLVVPLPNISISLSLRRLPCILVRYRHDNPVVLPDLHVVLLASLSSTLLHFHIHVLVRFRCDRLLHILLLVLVRHLVRLSRGNEGSGLGVECEGIGWTRRRGGAHHCWIEEGHLYQGIAASWKVIGVIF